MKRKVLDIKKNILQTLKINKKLSLKALEIKVNTGSQTIFTQLEELKFFKAIQFEKIKRNPKTGRPSTNVQLTKIGRNLI